MKITNKFNLPEPILRACIRHEHRGGAYSASMLTNSPRQVWLRKRHEKELIEDVSGRIWALFGTAFHSILEGNGGPGDATELYMEMEAMPGIKVSGSCDLYSAMKRKVTDYKTTSVWSIIYKSKTEEWTSQLNTYARMLTKMGLPVEGLEVVAMLRDWQESKVTDGGNYPCCQVVTVPLELWSADKSDAYIMDRIKLFESHKETPDNDLPECTKEETWDRGKGIPMRCQRYCACNAVCNQYEKLTEGK